MNADDHLQTRYFLANCSPVSLGNFLLARQNRAANLERDIADRVQELLEHLVYIELARVLRGRVPAARISQKSIGVTDLAPTPKLIPPEGWHWIWECTGLSHSRKSALQCIKKFCHAGHWGSFQRSELMTLTGLSRATLTRCFKELKAKYFIEIQFDKDTQIYFARVLKPPVDVAHGEPPLAHGEPPLAHGEPPLAHGEPPPGSQRATINNVLHVKDVRDVGWPNGNGGESGVRAVTPETPRADPSPAELEKLRLEAEILGRTERMQNRSVLRTELAAGQGPTSGPIKVNPEALKRAREREAKQKTKAAPQ